MRVGQSNSAETGVSDHISPSERSGLPLSPRFLSHTHIHTLTYTHITGKYTNTHKANACWTARPSLLAYKPPIGSESHDFPFILALNHT